MPDPRPGVVLDAGALIAVERRDRATLGRVRTLQRHQAPITLPATALAQVLRVPSRQALLMRLLKHAATLVVPLDEHGAIVVGRLLAASGTADIVDAHVVVCAQRSGHAIVTSDVGDLRRLDPAVELIAC